MRPRNTFLLWLADLGFSFGKAALSKLKPEPPQKQTCIPSTVVDAVLRMETKSARHWTAYPIDQVEVILRQNAMIEHNHYYAYFDEVNEFLVFEKPPF